MTDECAAGPRRRGNHHVIGTLILFRSFQVPLKLKPEIQAAAASGVYASLPARYTCYAASKARRVHFENWFKT